MRRYSPLLMILAFLGALGLSQVAPASAAQPTAPTSTSSLLHSSTLRGDAAAEPEEEGEEAEGEPEEVEFEFEEEVLLEECESAADEFEFEDALEEMEFAEEIAECEKEAKKGKSASATFVSAPEECVVERAESSIQTLPASDRIRLTVHYKNYSTGAVAIGLKLKDHKGTLALEHATRHLGRDGTLRLTTKLGEPEMERAEDAREFDVALRAPGTPGYCGDMLEQHLTVAASPAAHGSRAHDSSRVFRAPAKKD